MKTKTLTLAGLLLAASQLPLPALADLNKCNGVWTNRPCEDGASRTLNPSTATLDKDALQLLSKKKSLVHDLTMKTIAAKRDYNLRFDTDAVEQRCFEEATSLADCKKAVDELDAEVDRKLVAAAEIRAKQAEEQKVTEQQPATTSNNTAISITQSSDGYHYWRRRHPRPYPYGYGTVGPGSYQGTSSSTTTGGGISIQTGGNSGTKATINLGGTSHESTTTQTIQPLP